MAAKTKKSKNLKLSSSKSASVNSKRPSQKKITEKKPADKQKTSQSDKRQQPRIRYAVLGLGHIAQNSILPAFQHTDNSELVALISTHDEKLKKLGNEYGVKALYHYDALEVCIHEEQVDVVYIALPNKMHKDFALRAMQAGAHVLCEKPLGISSQECDLLYQAAKRSRVYLMTAYRLHFDQKNMEVVQLLKDKVIGEPKFFTSIFSFQVADENIRLSSQLGGGALFDLGVYPINAARYLFQSEPVSVIGKSIYHEDDRFTEVEGSASALLTFPGDKLAHFTCSFAAADSSFFEVVGSKGKLRLDKAYEINDEATLTITIDGKEQKKSFEPHDQFSAEIVYFSRCILNGEEPEPSAIEAKFDLEIIEAIRRSSQRGELVSMKQPRQIRYPSESQIVSVPPHQWEPLLVDVAPPHRTNGNSKHEQEGSR